jgi:hypothetical protein
LAPTHGHHELGHLGLTNFMLWICFHSHIFFVVQASVSMVTMNARGRLAQEGTLTFFNAVSDEFVNNLRSVARHDELPFSNGMWNGEAFDPLRVKAPLPDSICRVLEVTFERHIMTFFPHTVATEWSALRTIAGAVDSPVRRDFPPPLPDIHAAELSSVPGELLIETQYNTILYGYGWNHLVALRSNLQIIRLNKGDMILLRGDFIYATAGYETNNLIVHAYLDTPNYQRDEEGSDPHLVAVVDDVTVADESPFCYVHNCPFVASGVTSLRRHFNRYHSFFFGQPRG